MNLQDLCTGLPTLVFPDMKYLLRFGTSQNRFCRNFVNILKHLEVQACKIHWFIWKIGTRSRIHMLMWTHTHTEWFTYIHRHKRTHTHVQRRPVVVFRIQEASSPCIDCRRRRRSTSDVPVHSLRKLTQNGNAYNCILFIFNLFTICVTDFKGKHLILAIYFRFVIMVTGIMIRWILVVVFRRFNLWCFLYLRKFFAAHEDRIHDLLPERRNSSSMS